MKNKENKLPHLLLLIVGAILILVPIYLTVVSSFKDTPQIMQHFFSLPKPFTMENYTRLIEDGIGKYFLNSVIISVVSIIMIILVVPMAAFSIARNIGRKTAFTIMYSLLILGIFVPFQLIMLPITNQMTAMGLMNLPGLMLLYLTYAIPQTLFLYVGYIKLSIPESLDEAAEIDGANKMTMFIKVAFPLMKPMHATTLILNALWIWNDFLLPLLILNRDDSFWTLPLFQYNYQGQYMSDFGPSFASYIIGIVTITIVYLFFQKRIISGMSNGAVK